MLPFAADARIRGRRGSGRVEHLRSGGRVRFDPNEELVQIPGRLLDEREPPEEK